MLSEIMYSLSFQLVIKQALIKLSTIDVEYFFFQKTGKCQFKDKTFWIKAYICTILESEKTVMKINRQNIIQST